MQIHPELRDAVEALPAVDWMADINWSRDAMKEAVRTPTLTSRVSVEGRIVKGGDGQDLELRIYRPAGTATAAPVALWFHGGGFALGDLDSEDASCRMIASERGITVIAPDYRLAPEHPFPRGFDDCWQTLLWVDENARALEVDPKRIALGGHSAGAALAAAVALACRDRQGPTPAALYLGYPVLHDQPETQSMADATDPRLWNAQQVRAMWSTYLQGRDATPYAAPARATDLRGLPYTYVVVHGADPHRDEALDFILRLARSDVLVEAHLVPGAPHMADVYAPDSLVIKRSIQAWTGALAQALL